MRLFKTWYCAYFPLLLAIGCDQFESDLIQRQKQVVFSETEFFVFPRTSVIINLEAIIKESFVTATCKVSRAPKLGTLSQLQPLLLRYEPHTAYSSGTDDFAFDLLAADGSVIKQQTITLRMVKSAADLPCVLYAAGDVLDVLAGSSVSVKFMRNDRICGLPSHLTVSVSLYTKHGKAELAGDSIVYTPDPGFLGEDNLIYKLSSGANGSVNTMGEVIFKVSDIDKRCQLAQYNFMIDLTDNFLDEFEYGDNGSCPGYTFGNIWQYNEGCRTGNGSEPGNISTVSFGALKQSGHSGSFCMGMDASFAYYPASDRMAQNDTARVDICINHLCKVATFIVIRESNTSPHLENTITWSYPDRSPELSVTIFRENPPGSNVYVPDSSRLGCCSFSGSKIPGGASDGKYAIAYDIERQSDDLGVDFVSVFTSFGGLINGQKETISFSGHDDGLLTAGSRPYQYFEKGGNDYFNFSPMSSGTSPAQLHITLLSNPGDGTGSMFFVDFSLSKIKMSGKKKVENLLREGSAVEILASDPNATFLNADRWIQANADAAIQDGFYRLKITTHTYFIGGLFELHVRAENATINGLDVPFIIKGGDFKDPRFEGVTEPVSYNPATGYLDRVTEVSFHKLGNSIYIAQ